MAGAGDVSAVRPRDTSIRGGQIEGQANRTEKSLSEGQMGQGRGQDIWVFFLVVW